MPRIAAVATANPKHSVSQESVVEFAKSIYGENKLFQALLPVFENAMVKTRYLSADLEWLRVKHSFAEKNDFYIETALALSEQVSLELASKCGIHTEQFDAVFFLSTTGVSTPSIDARLFNRIPLNPHIKRIPIWGLGCAAGAAGLARANDYLLAHPTHRALIIAVELCSLSFQLVDPSKTDFISAAIFGDGAAACAVFGDAVPAQDFVHSQPALLGSMSTIYPDSLNVMSWRITGDGFKVQLSRNIPAIVTSLVKGNIEEILQEHELDLKDLSHFIFHPGGAKVLQAFAEGLSVSGDKFANSFSVLRDFGNMSSATVFYVLKRFLENTKHHSGEFGVLGALGPGFSSELLLLHWS